MNPFLAATLTILGVGWCFVEALNHAGAGSWLPLTVWLVAFTLAFSALGCLDLKESVAQAVSMVVVLAMVALALLFTAKSFMAGTMVIGVCKLIGAALLAWGGLGTLKKPAPAHA